MNSEEALKSRYGAFAPMFLEGAAGVPRYLEFLGLRKVLEAPSDALEVLRKILRADPTPDDELVALFTDVNWRPHLVGVVALVVAPRAARPLGELWSAFDAGSWVTPQLAACASVVDSEFLSKAKARVEAAYLPSPRPLSSSLAEAAYLHSARGPEGNQEREAKKLQSLLALLGEQPDERARSVLFAAREDFAPLALTYAKTLRVLAKAQTTVAE